ncbi:MAG TPA: metallophosphoesterase [Burkholderiaceae bacterium]|nr:metallophosphoesterase [Burkholderiaceae bacterium]
MKIQLLSDLHLELHPYFQPVPAPGADLLVLAGDIGSYQGGSRLTDTDFGLARFSPLPQYAAWPTPVIFVPGNHEYDGLDFDETHARLRETCERLGMIWLERETFALHGVRFIGTTLWSDFDALGDASDASPKGQARNLELRDKAFRAANYYLKKAATLRGGEVWLADGVRAQALICQAWLREALAQPFAGDTVVVTHFAPSLRSGDPRYGRAPGTAGFCNALDALLPQARLWLHGHLHCPSDYRHQGCRVVANPMGYAAKGEQEQFDPLAIFKLRD